MIRKVNFLYGFLGAAVVVSITVRIDIAVFLAYLSYYFFLGKIVNRPKYVTDLGKFIVFPIPTAVGAFTGYKLAPHIINFILWRGGKQKKTEKLIMI